MTQNRLPDAEDRAVELITELAQHRWDSVRRDFTPAMATHLDVEGLASAWGQVAGTVGCFEAMGEPLVRQLGDFTVVDVPLSFEAGEMTARVSYDAEAQVVGLYILDATAVAGAQARPRD